MDDFDNSKLKHEDFETTWLTVNNVYPYFEFKSINWDSLHVVYSNKIENSKGDEYINVLFDLLCELKDAHVGLYLLNGDCLGQVTPRMKKDKNAFDLNLTIEYLNNNYDLVGDGNIGFATINGDIGYIYIRTFLDWESRWVYAINNIINQFSETKGLIIDVRHNDGGSVYNGNYIISHFLNSDLQTPGSYYLNQYRDGHVISPKLPYYNKKVVVLTNGICLSSTEHFVMSMQEIENVILLGDTTGGGSGYPDDYPLPSGLKIRISRVNYLQYNQTPIEWNGIIPDILVPQTEKDVKNKIDKQLTRAIEYLEQ
jgi:C-terminal processing protease CtpA/Prc